jgi:hypothetical protein
MASAAGGDSQDVINRRNALGENEKKINNMIFEKNIAKLVLETDIAIKKEIIDIVNDESKLNSTKMAELKDIRDKNREVVKNVIMLARLKPLVDQRTVLFNNLQAAKTLQTKQAVQASNLAQASQASQVPMASVPSSPTQVTPALPQGRESILKRCLGGLCGKDADSRAGGKRRKTTTRKQKGRRTAKKHNKNKKSRKQ